jgi:hypothetical protein
VLVGVNHDRGLRRAPGDEAEKGDTADSSGHVRSWPKPRSIQVTRRTIWGLSEAIAGSTAFGPEGLGSRRPVVVSDVVRNALAFVD